MRILDPNTHGNVEDVIEHKKYTPFYMHRTSHWLGMDVHDCGAYVEPIQNQAAANFTSWSDLDPLKTQGAHAAQSRLLKPGMVLTLEPGLYIRPSPDVAQKYWNIGVRIEDDALVLPQGIDLLSRGVPVSVADIEQLMA